MKTKLRALSILLFCSFLVSSCGTSPTVIRRSDGSYAATAGFNLLGRNKGVKTRIVMPDGVIIEHEVADSDNTAVASNYIGYKTVTNLADNVTSRLRSSDRVKAITEKGKADALVKGTKDPNVIPVDPNIAPAAAPAAAAIP
jgi:hypothetical protein